MTEQLHFHFSLSYIGEGNGNPLQCSYLENPRDAGTWWAAIYGITQSWTQLKQLSNSSSSSKLTKWKSSRAKFCIFSKTWVVLFAHYCLKGTSLKDQNVWNLMNQWKELGEDLGARSYKLINQRKEFNFYFKCEKLWKSFKGEYIWEPWIFFRLGNRRKGTEMLKKKKTGKKREIWD